MKHKVLLGSMVIGVLVTAIPAFNEGFTPTSIGEWFFNALFVTAILGFLGVKFLVGDSPRSSSPPKKNIKKK